MTLTITTTMLEGNARNMDRTLPRRPARRFLAFVSSLPSLRAIGSDPTTPYSSVTPHFLEDGDLHAIFMNYLWISSDSLLFRGQTHPSRSRMLLILCPSLSAPNRTGFEQLWRRSDGMGKKGLPTIQPCTVGSPERVITQKEETAYITRLGASGCDVWTLMRIAGHSSIFHFEPVRASARRYD
jgi:hypothetical protein